ncbi:MAG: DUF402 domain-containing protein [Dehalococcoidia bacterium]
MTDRFQPGDPIAWRNTKDGVVVWAAALRVIHDRPDELALWLCEGTPFWSMADAGGQPTRDFRAAHHLVERRWGMFEFVWLVRPGEAHAAWCAFQLPHRTHAGWYINLQRPFERTSIGFDSLDHTLDLQVAPNLTDWRWKDEDELADGVGLGIYTQAEAEAFRAEGERVLARIRAREAPFGDGWDQRRLPSSWGPAAMPAGWEVAGGTRLFRPGDRWA